MRFLQILLHEAGEENVAAHVDFFLDVETFSWSIEAEFQGLSRLTWHVTADEIFASEIQTGRRKGVRLEAIWKIVEACFVGDLSVDAREVVDPGEFVVNHVYPAEV